ncbi:MAG: shikimate dehydrogenase [Gemmatimonadaceae bacterium]
MSQTPALPGRLVLLGHPVAHSLSPVFQNAALSVAGIPLRYEALDVTPLALEDVLRELRAVGAAGNVTIPHKQAVYAVCDEVTDVARRVGAVNTFWTERGRLHADNTDVAGFDAAVRALGTERRGAVIALFGAGGAAAAVCTAAEQWTGARVRIVARSAERATVLATRFPGLVAIARSVPEALTSAMLVINATPVGLDGTSVPVSVTDLPRDADVMDLVYRPGQTPWVRQAQALGLRAVDGREMLLRQGALAFSRWFGRAPDLSVMRAALERAAS